MTEPVKFGRQAAERPAFQINELTFAGLPLSLTEEKQLAQTGESATDQDAVDAVLGVLAELLNKRVQGKASVTSDWLMDNLASSDLEGIVEYLRNGPTPV
jgi:hypothetical protein